MNALDFSSPVTTGTVGALDGNAAANRTSVSGTISGLSIAPGQTFWIRWSDFNVTGSDDGLGVDDFSLTPHTAHTISVADATVTEGDSGTTTASFAVSLSTPAPAGGVIDCGSGYGAFGSSSTASCPTTDVGDRSVGGKIRDELGAVTEYRGTVHVVVTFDSLCSLVHSYARHQEDADKLCALLDAAEAADGPKTRANILKSFRNTVDGMTGPQPGKSSPPSRAGS